MTDDALGDQSHDPDNDAESIDESASAVSSKHNERKQARLKREQRESDDFWRNCLSTEIGRRELWRIACGASGAHAFETRYAVGPNGFPDTHATMAENAVQQFGLRLYHQWIALDPLAVQAMHLENDHRFAHLRQRDKAER